MCTYPCISFRRQRVSHPGAEPGSGRLDGDGVADARQFATCWKERSEIGEHLEQRPAGYSGYLKTYYFHFYFTSKTPEGRWELMASFLLLHLSLFSSQDVLCRRRLLFRSHMLMPVFTPCEEVCEKVRGRWEIGERERQPLCILLLCAPLVSRCSVN